MFSRLFESKAARQTRFQRESRERAIKLAARKAAWEDFVCKLKVVVVTLFVGIVGLPLTLVIGYQFLLAPRSTASTSPATTTIAPTPSATTSLVPPQSQPRLTQVPNTQLAQPKAIAVAPAVESAIAEPVVATVPVEVDDDSSPFTDDQPNTAPDITGKVLSIASGDKFTFRVDKTLMSIVLYGIDAPDPGQKYSEQATDALRKLMSSKEVTLQQVLVNDHASNMALVIVDDEYVADKMVEAGWAWRNPDVTDRKLAELEKEARAARRGLWADDNPVSPWAFRARATQSKSITSTASDRNSEQNTASSEASTYVPRSSDSSRTSRSGTTRKSGYEESEWEKAYEAANGVEIVHRKDGTTYERRARSSGASSSSSVSARPKTVTVHMKNGTTYMRAAPSRRK